VISAQGTGAGARLEVQCWNRPHRSAVNRSHLNPREKVMGILDSLVSGGLKGVLGQVEAAAMPALISTVLAKTNLGDLQGLVNQLQQGGLGTQVQSWLGSGQNLPVSPAQLQSALGSDQVRELARHFGIDPDAALKLLAEHLPSTVDQASPNGTLNAGA
jgi:uncharacterized protein YidB (DUF937 family)